MHTHRWIDLFGFGFWVGDKKIGCKYTRKHLQKENNGRKKQLFYGDLKGLLWGPTGLHLRKCHFVWTLSVISSFLNYVNNYISFRWFHGSITRDEAEHLLQPRDEGLFLVRESTNFPGDYTLCVCFQSKVEHYRVKYLENKLTIDDEEYFENLSLLVAVSSPFFNSFQISQFSELNLH